MASPDLLVLLLAIAVRESVAHETCNVDPSRVIQLSWQPRVFFYRGFLSAEECDHLIYWQKSSEIADGSSRNETKFGAASVKENDELTRRIEERISAWTFLPLENSKGLQVLHVGVESSKKDLRYFESGGQTLLASVILYLSNVTDGGQIVFPSTEEKSSLSDCSSRRRDKWGRPGRGNAVVFFNLHLNGTPDENGAHTRCPVVKGEMWYATKLFYLKKFEDDDGEEDCRDEDDNCSGWAAQGECRKNPVFMVGSPDYYGACRKSCNACSLDRV